MDVPKPDDATVSVFADKFLISLRSDWQLKNKAQVRQGVRKGIFFNFRASLLHILTLV